MRWKGSQSAEAPVGKRIRCEISVRRCGRRRYPRKYVSMSICHPTMVMSILSRVLFVIPHRNLLVVCPMKKMSYTSSEHLSRVVTVTNARIVLWANTQHSKSKKLPSMHKSYIFCVKIVEHFHIFLVAIKRSALFRAPGCYSEASSVWIRFITRSHLKTNTPSILNTLLLNIYCT